MIKGISVAKVHTPPSVPKSVTGAKPQNSEEEQASELAHSPQ